MYGTLDDSKVLEEEASKTDILIRMLWPSSDLRPIDRPERALIDKQILPMHQTMKEQPRPLLQAWQQGTARRSPDTGSTLAAQAS